MLLFAGVLSGGILLKSHPYKGHKIGTGPFKSTWYSFCSVHQHPETGCSRCMSGNYRNDVKRYFGSIIYRKCPKIWRWWANRRK